MKIAVVGAACTGKTTIARALSRGQSLPLIENPLETITTGTGYNTAFEWSEATRGFCDLFEHHAGRERRTDSGIIDNGVMDLFCFIQRWIWNRLSPNRVEDLYRTVREVAKTYVGIVVTAPVIVAPAAPWRFRSVAAVLQEHRLTVALLQELRLAGKALFLSELSERDATDAALAFVRTLVAG